MDSSSIVDKTIADLIGRLGATKDKGIYVERNPGLEFLVPTAFEILKNYRTATVTQFLSCAALFRMMFNSSADAATQCSACYALLANFSGALASGLVFLGDEVTMSRLGKGANNEVQCISSQGVSFAFKKNNAGEVTKDYLEEKNARAIVHSAANVIADLFGNDGRRVHAQAREAFVQGTIGMAMTAVRGKTLLRAASFSSGLLGMPRFRQQSNYIQLIHWIHGNPDGHADNVIVNENGNIVVIDDDRGFSSAIAPNSNNCFTQYPPPSKRTIHMYCLPAV
ncbi:MAG: hypothetical protein LBB14_03585, partial [Puniceicoccales bacterium]|nr:hypothetical protein [Puniceicoccales bacterium]